MCNWEGTLYKRTLGVLDKFRDYYSRILNFFRLRSAASSRHEYVYLCMYKCGHPTLLVEVGVGYRE